MASRYSPCRKLTTCSSSRTTSSSRTATSARSSNVSDDRKGGRQGRAPSGLVNARSRARWTFSSCRSFFLTLSTCKLAMSHLRATPSWTSAPSSSWVASSAPSPSHHGQNLMKQQKAEGTSPMRACCNRRSRNRCAGGGTSSARPLHPPCRRRKRNRNRSGAHDPRSLRACRARRCPFCSGSGSGQTDE